MNPPRIEVIDFHGHEARRLGAGAVEAIFLPALGMLCASLTVGSEEMLGRTDEFQQYIDRGSTLGIPLLHPWANRLEGFYYTAVGRGVVLDRKSPKLHYDANGLPMHGMPGARLTWEVTAEETDGTLASLSARLDWSGFDRLEIFPYPHWLDMKASVDAGGLTLETVMTPRGDIAVPIAFGYHPYVCIPGVPRGEWTLELPSLRRLALDERKIPNGIEELYSWDNGLLGDHAFDHAFRLMQPRPRFSISAAGRRITLAFLEGYTHTQIYAPRDGDFIAIEPMTAPGNALVSGHELRSVPPKSIFRATFRIEL